MKYQYIIMAALGLLLMSCEQNSDFETPALNPIPIVLEGKEITISTLRELLIQEQTNNENLVLSFTETNMYITGYVISSDEAGNFFEELIIQDAIQNPSSGVKVLVDVNPLFVSYEFGRKVHIRLDGLAVGYNSGVLTLGILDRGSVDKIPESQEELYIIRDTTVAQIVATPMVRDEFTSEKTNLYIHLEDVQFRDDEVLGDQRKTYAAEPTDAFDGERRLVFCENRRSVIFSTSTFADFKALLLPRGRGSLDGLLQYNFFGDEFNVVVNSPVNIAFEDIERCDPIYLDCGLASDHSGIIVFGDTFESQENNDPISGNGWTNLSQEGTVLWEGFDGSSNNPPFGKISAQIGSFNSGDCSTITWLITPELDFDTINNATLTFLTSTSFADESILEVLVSSNWDGTSTDVNSFEWATLSSARIANPRDPFQDYIPSGIIDLSCIEGKGYVAWRYTGSGDTGFDGTYELDEIEIKSN
ncbi:MAG: DUF5689 domain-containing protein [Bacteroidota bacterium]